MKPKLRALEITPVEYEGENHWYFNDRAGFARGAAIPHAWGALLSLFDGTRDVPAIIAAYEKKQGEKLPSEAVEQIIQQMDDAYFLDSPRFEKHRGNLVGEFEAATSRPAALAGSAYRVSRQSHCLKVPNSKESSYRISISSAAARLKLSPMSS